MNLVIYRLNNVYRVVDKSTNHSYGDFQSQHLAEMFATNLRQQYVDFLHKMNTRQQHLMNNMIFNEFYGFSDKSDEFTPSRFNIQTEDTSGINFNDVNYLNVDQLGPPTGMSGNAFDATVMNATEMIPTPMNPQYTNPKSQNNQISSQNDFIAGQSQQASNNANTAQDYSQNMNRSQFQQQPYAMAEAGAALDVENPTFTDEIFDSSLLDSTYLGKNVGDLEMLDKGESKDTPIASTTGGQRTFKGFVKAPKFHDVYTIDDRSQGETINYGFDNLYTDTPEVKNEKVDVSAIGNLPTISDLDFENTSSFDTAELFSSEKKDQKSISQGKNIDISRTVITNDDSGVIIDDSLLNDDLQDRNLAAADNTSDLQTVELKKKKKEKKNRK